MIKRIVFSAGLAFLTLPAAAQTAPDAASPRATQADPPAAPSAGAPKPYTPPDNTTDGGTEAPPAQPAPAVSAVPPTDPVMQQAAEGLPTQIEDVQVVGPWAEGDQRGVWRTAMMQVGQPEKDVYRFFVQKLDRVGPGAKILSTTEIKEIAGVSGTIVGYRADEPEEDQTQTTDDLTLFFDVVPTTGEIPESYELHFMKDLTYTFGPASN